MKHLFSILTLVLTLFCSTHLQGKEFRTAEKIYIAPEQLGVTPDGIFIEMNDDWIQVNAIYSDHYGIYFTRAALEPNGCRKGFTPCRNCKRCVREQYNICPLCSKPV